MLTLVAVNQWEGLFGSFLGRHLRNAVAEHNGWSLLSKAPGDQEKRTGTVHLGLRKTNPAGPVECEKTSFPPSPVSQPLYRDDVGQALAGGFGQRLGFLRIGQKGRTRWPKAPSDTVATRAT